uniref:Glycosyltransferase family 2 protein n=2 Tax=unclassified Prevotella TaxID=2638335 RepID=A0AB33IXK2_9BACT
MITVFTPTYNRAHLLYRLYDSLKNQTYKNFEWLIVDDGSIDNTSSVVQKMIDDSKVNALFPIRYLKKENGGKHTAINWGVKEAEGELFFIADSDDMLPTSALEDVEKEYSLVKDDLTIGAIVGYDSFKNTSIKEYPLPFMSIDCTFVDFWSKFNIVQDMKEVFRTSVLREYPFPEVAGENFCPEELAWLRISRHYKNHYINRMIYIAEYQPEGLSSNITKMRMQSPILATWDYAEYNEYDIPIGKKIRNAINYWRFYFCIKDKSNIKKKIGMQWIWLKPVGWLFHCKDVIKVK